MIKQSSELKDLVEVFYNKFKDLTENITSKKLSDEKWSLKEIIGHLIDSASNNHQRFVRMQIESSLDFPSYHYSWIDIEKYNSMNFKNLLELWKYYNLFLSEIMKNINDAVICNNWNSDRGKINLQDLVIDYIRHLKDHILHFEERIVEINKQS